MRALWLVLLLVLAPSIAAPAPIIHDMDFPAPERPTAATPELFHGPCAQMGVPPALALAIAMQESGLKPWAINIEGKGFFPRSREEALALLRQAQADGRSFDTGLMQINSYWLRRYGLPLEVVLDPRQNVVLGVWILAKEIQRYGLTWQAVASYHTPLERNPERGRRYAESVLRRLSTIQAAAR